MNENWLDEKRCTIGVKIILVLGRSVFWGGEGSRRYFSKFLSRKKGFRRSTHLMYKETVWKKLCIRGRYVCLWLFPRTHRSTVLVESRFSSTLPVHWGTWVTNAFFCFCHSLLTSPAMYSVTDTDLMAAKNNRKSFSKGFSFVLGFCHSTSRVHQLAHLFTDADASRAPRWRTSHHWARPICPPSSCTGYGWSVRTR